MLHLYQAIRYSKSLMVIHHYDELTGGIQSAIFRALISASIILMLGLVVAVIQACPQVRDNCVWGHVMNPPMVDIGEPMGVDAPTHPNAPTTIITYPYPSTTPSWISNPFTSVILCGSLSRSVSKVEDDKSGAIWGGLDNWLCQG